MERTLLNGGKREAPRKSLPKPTADTYPHVYHEGKFFVVYHDETTWSALYDEGKALKVAAYIMEVRKIGEK